MIPFFQIPSNGVSGKEIALAELGTSLDIISTLSASTPKEIAHARRPSILVDLKISAPTILVHIRLYKADLMLIFLLD